MQIETELIRETALEKNGWLKMKLHLTHNDGNFHYDINFVARSILFDKLSHNQLTHFTLASHVFCRIRR